MLPSPLLLTAAQIAGLPAAHKVHFLNPCAVRLDKSLGDATGLQHLGVHLVTVPPGHASSEYHRHDDEEECIYVLSGRGEIDIEGETHALAAGDFAGFPANTAAHVMRNTDATDLVCLVVGQRLAQDVCDYPRQGKRLYRRNGRWDLVALSDIVHPQKK